MPQPPDLATLLLIVDERSEGADPLTRLAVAEGLLDELRGTGDRLIGYLVELARADGCSWSDVGERLGISRQAAQQRYGWRWSSLTLADLAQSGAFDRFTARARDTLTRAEAHARELRQSAIGMDHVLLGILDDADTLAVKAIAAQGVDPAGLRASLARRLPAGNDPSPEMLPIAAAARRGFSAALVETAELGHNYIGTEHLLLGLLRDRSGAAGEFLRENGLALDATRAVVRAALDALLRSREA